jgi:hypothetical protein
MVQAYERDIVLLPLTTLRVGPSVRLGGINAEYVRELASSRGSWPPIVVARGDHTIIDGRYRYLAAQMLGVEHIAATYFEGTSEAAYVEAIRLNISYGLPLSLRERKYAASVILATHPEWSDRRIAGLCALANQTVAQVRRGCQTDQSHQFDRREGRDGKVRPIGSATARHKAILRVMRDHPGASLREVARLAGTSHETARAVRANSARQCLVPDDHLAPSVATPAPAEVACDPAFTSTPEGSAFATWFVQTSVDDTYQHLVAAVPLSRVYGIADEARRRSRVWSSFAEELESRVVRRSSAQ